MIPRSTQTPQPSPTSGLRSLSALRERFGHDGLQDVGVKSAADQFPVLIPAAFADKIRPSDPADPLLRQVVPSAQETLAVEGYRADPVGDVEASPVPGVIHKYQGRVLLVGTGACAIHCRYCFRRAFPYPEATASKNDWSAAIEYIARDDSIAEVILSGGDPLTLSVDKLRSVTEQLQMISHVRRLRIHTRLPAAAPERLADPATLAWLAESTLQKVVVVHVNHANELGDDTDAAFAQLRRTGAVLLNQSVLLRDVNDDAAALHRLSERLFASGVLPYYLNMLDKAAGTAHFAVPKPRANVIMHELRSQTSGFLVPRLVEERAGAPYKLPLL